jgi:hypothetical protein
VKAPVITALVLVGVLLSPIVLDVAGVASRSGGGHGSGHQMEGGGHDFGERDSDGHGSNRHERGSGDHD